MCVLAPNVVNSYFFIIFWFLLIISLVANLFSVLFTTTSYLFTLGKLYTLLATFIRHINPLMFDGIDDKPEGEARGVYHV